MATLRARTLTITIDCPPPDVYGFVSNVENLPQWAAGFGKTVRRVDDDWQVESPQGWVGIRFVEANLYGVLDHVVTISPEVSVTVPMRVVANGAGSEVLFTLFQTPEMSDEQFHHDGELVAADLQRLKTLLEAPQLT